MAVGIIRNLGGGGSKVLPEVINYYENGVSKLIWDKQTSGITEDTNYILNGIAFDYLSLTTPNSAWYNAKTQSFDCNGYNTLILKGNVGTVNYGGARFKVVGDGTTITGFTLDNKGGSQSQDVNVALDVSNYNNVYISIDFNPGGQTKEYVYARFSKIALSK